MYIYIYINIYIYTHTHEIYAIDDLYQELISYYYYYYCILKMNLIMSLKLYYDMCSSCRTKSDCLSICEKRFNITK